MSFLVIVACDVTVEQLGTTISVICVVEQGIWQNMYSPEMSAFNCGQEMHVVRMYHVSLKYLKLVW